MAKRATTRALYMPDDISKADSKAEIFRVTSAASALAENCDVGVETHLAVKLYWSAMVGLADH